RTVRGTLKECPYAGALLDAPRLHHRIRIVNRHCDDAIAVALETDRRSGAAGGVKRVLPLMEQIPVDGADARHHQRVFLQADDERVARTIAERVAADER